MWGVPVDHEMFDDVNRAQWWWYYYNTVEDRNESFENSRDLVEYHASFIEPEAVRKIRESRDDSVSVPYDQFIAGIEYMFGKKIDLSEKPKKGEIVSSMRPEAAVRKSDMYKKYYANVKPKQTVSYKHWLDIDLE